LNASYGIDGSRMWVFLGVLITLVLAVWFLLWGPDHPTLPAYFRYRKLRSRKLPIPSEEQFIAEFPLQGPLTTFMINLYRYEGFFSQLPAFPISFKQWSPNKTTARYAIDVYVGYLDKFERLSAQPDIWGSFREALSSAIDVLDTTLPQEHESALRVPLKDIINPSALMARFAGTFYKRGELFRRLDYVIQSNLDEEPEFETLEEAIHEHFKGTPFEDFFLQLFEASASFHIAQHLRFEGHWIVAPPGRGKTTLLRSLFHEDLKAVRENRASVIIMDSKGDFINEVKNLQLFAPGQPLYGKLVLIEPDPDYPLALNPLDVTRGSEEHLSLAQRKARTNHTVGLLEYLFSALLEAKMTALQSTMFRAVLRSLVEVIPDPTIETFRDIITNGYEPYLEYLERARNSISAARWTAQKLLSSITILPNSTNKARNSSLASLSRSSSMPRAAARTSLIMKRCRPTFTLTNAKPSYPETKRSPPSSISADRRRLASFSRTSASDKLFPRTYSTLWQTAPYASPTVMMMPRSSPPASTRHLRSFTENGVHSPPMCET
jgi:hypothetical protein